MQPIRQRFSRMNLDSDVRDLKPGDVRLLTNAITVQPNVSGAQNINIVSSLYGHAKITNGDIQEGERTLASLEDKVGNRLFYFNYHSGDDHTIYVYDYAAGTISIVLRTDLFDWDPTDTMSADIIGDILVFTANNGPIWKLNVATAIAGDYTPTLTELKLIKRAPQLPLTGVTAVTILISTNKIYQHAFQFYYRYIYDDNEPSVFSALSKTVTGITSTHNLITVTIPAGETIPATVKQIDFAVRIDGTNEFSIYNRVFPVGGVLASRDHEFFNDVYLETVSDSQSLKWNDSVPRQAKAIRIFNNRLFSFNNVEGYDYTASPIPIIATASHAAANISGNPYYKEGSAYNFGVMFWDADGRHAGVHVGSSYPGLGSRVIIPDDRINASPTLSPYIVTVDLTGINSTTYIPDWATHYSVVRTNCNIPFFIQYLCADVKYWTKAADGTYTLTDTYGATLEGLAIDISTFTTVELGYTFQAGDRVKLYYQNAPTTPAGSLNVDLEIKAQDGKYIYTGLYNLGNNPTAYVIEIYTPSPATQDIFYEVGSKFAITNAGLGSRALSTTSVTPDGDSTQAITGGLAAMNAFQKYYTNWIRRTGRSVVATAVGSKELAKETYIRWGQEFDTLAGSNNMSVFEALDEQQLPIENGPGTDLAESGEVLVAVHQAETTAVYVGQGFVSTANGNNFLAKTDNVVGDVRRNLGGHGCRHQMTVVPREGRTYYLDIQRGFIIRRSQDGLTRISDYGVRGLVGTLCQYHQTLTGSTISRIIAGWDPQYDCYCIFFGEYTVSYPSGNYLETQGTGYTLYFHEGSNSWVCKAEMKPEAFGWINQKQAMFRAGALWLQTPESNYGKFFGLQTTRTVAFEIGADSLEKIWTALEVDIENIYTTAGSNEDVVLLYHTAGGTLQTRINYADFRLRGSAWRSAFFRTLNDAAYSSTTESKYKSPHKVRGQSAYLTIAYVGTDRNPMKSITVLYEPSLLSYP